MDAWNTSDDPARIFEKGIVREWPINWIFGTDFYPPTNIVSTAKAKPLQEKYDAEIASQTFAGRITGLFSKVVMKAVELVGGPSRWNH
ncbi:MAG UNVERIFIED_CONTAM: hypothetical protein LVT10_10425 [Anaerolineae bacterium]|jgi:hypothetical protein